MVNIKDYKSGFVLFAMPYEDESDIKYAKEYCLENNLTTKDVFIKIRRIKNEKSGQEDKFLLVMVK